MKKWMLLLPIILLASCANLSERQKDGLTIAAMVAVGIVLINHDGSGNTMCDENPQTLQPPCAE